MAGIFSLRKFLMKKLMKPDASGIMKIPEKGRIDFTEHFLKEKLFTNGIDHRLINNERQLENILQSIDDAEANKLKQKADKIGLNDPSKNKFMKEGEVIEVDFGGFPPEKKAGGGRTGLNYSLAEDTNERMPYAGGGMGRRAFLKLMAALGATGVAAKSGLVSLLGKSGKKKVAQELTSVPIKNIKGMPEWFKPLVNKVIKEGKEMKVTEYDRLVTHKSELPNSKTDIYVNQDLNTGDVWVDVGIGKHGWGDGLHGQPVRLEYKAAEEIEPNTIGGGYITKEGENVYPGMGKGVLKTEETTGKGMKTKEEFWVEEAEFTGGHPENVKFEDVSYEKFGDHGSNFDEVEEFATGKVKKKIKSKPRPMDKKDIEYASGGIARMLGE